MESRLSDICLRCSLLLIFLAAFVLGQYPQAYGGGQYGQYGQQYPGMGAGSGFYQQPGMAGAGYGNQMGAGVGGGVYGGAYSGAGGYPGGQQYGYGYGGRYGYYGSAATSTVSLATFVLILTLGCLGSL